MSQRYSAPLRVPAVLGTAVLEGIRADIIEEHGEGAPLCRWCLAPAVGRAPGVAAIACQDHQGEAAVYAASLAAAQRDAA